MAEVNVTIKAHDQTRGAFDAVESSASSAFTKLQAGCVALAAKFYLVQSAVMGVVPIFQKAWGLMSEFAEFAEQKSALDALAQKYGQTADYISESVSMASKGLISSKDAISTATAAIAKGLNPDQIRGLAEAAETLSDTAGVSVPNAFRQLTEAVALGKERGAEALVGIIDINAKYGEQINTLADVEKAYLRYNEVMEKVKGMKDQLGDSTDSLADRMDRLKVTIENMKLHLGSFLTRAGLGLMGLWEALKSAFLMLGRELIQPIVLLEKLINKLSSIPGVATAVEKLGLKGLLSSTFWQDTLAAQDKALGNAKENMMSNFKGMIASSEELSKAMGGARKGRVVPPVPDPAPVKTLTDAFGALGTTASTAKTEIEGVAEAVAKTSMFEPITETFEGVTHITAPTAGYADWSKQQKKEMGTWGIADLKAEYMSAIAEIQRISTAGGVADITQLTELQAKLSNIKNELQIFAEPKLMLAAFPAEIVKINDAFTDLSTAGIAGTKAAVESLNMEILKDKTIQVSNAAGLQRIAEVHNAINSIPDVSVKTIIVRTVQG